MKRNEFKDLSIKKLTEISYFVKENFKTGKETNIIVKRNEVSLEELKKNWKKFEDFKENILSILTPFIENDNFEREIDETEKHNSSNIFKGENIYNHTRYSDVEMRNVNQKNDKKRLKDNKKNIVLEENKFKD